jgi:hypothetical protein
VIIIIKRGKMGNKFNKKIAHADNEVILILSKFYAKRTSIDFTEIKFGGKFILNFSFTSNDEMICCQK